MLQGDGGGIGVDTAQLEAAAASYRSLSQDVAGTASDLIASLATAENAVGDPSASGAISDLIEAWVGPLGLMGPLLDQLANSVASSANVYHATDSAVARHAQ